MTPREKERGRVHPLVADYQAFGDAHLDLFQGTAEGKYLANRINEAFTQGWLACEKRIKDALEGR